MIVNAAAQANLTYLDMQAHVGITKHIDGRNGHGFLPGSASLQRNVFSIRSQAISLLVERQATLEIEAEQRNRSVRIHLIDLYADDDPGLWNFSRAAELIAAGRRLTEEYLKTALSLPPSTPAASTRGSL
ncbi:MAG: hypothetical protein HGB05_09345 [Chloroflexi bacterium]|nr:hypothetical protein [Chloroflexota bacterium]